MKFQWPTFKRSSGHSKRSYSGAVMSRLTSDWITMSTSADAEIRGSLKMLRNRTRQLERDNDYIQSYLREVENNVVGLGIQMQPQIKMVRGKKLNEGLNTQIRDAWLDWCDKDSCHVAGKLSFFQMERLLARSVARDGELVFREIRQTFGESKIPYALEIIEADRLDDDFNGRAENGNEVKMGVELSQWGKPTAYNFFTYHPGDYPFSGSAHSSPRRLRIPADEVIHPFVTHRAGQTRGVPWMASAIMRLRHMQGYEEAEVIAARSSASLMGFVTTPEGEIKGDGLQDGQRVSDFEPGVFKYLAPGETVSIPNNSRPGGQFSPFMKMMLRGTAAGIGGTYETISKDFSESNYSSSRLALLADRDNWRSVQNWMVENFHQQVFEGWLEMAVLSGQLNIPDYELNVKKYEAVRWMPRGWAWVDPQKEVTAYREAILGGLTSATKIIAQEGEDIEDLYNEIDAERNMASKLGLVFDTDAKNGVQSNKFGPDPSLDEIPKAPEIK